MAEAETKVPVKTEKRPEPTAALRPFEGLRREINRLFDDFRGDGWPFSAGRTVFDLEPFWRSEFSWGSVPTVDVAEKDDAYEVTAELPGMDEKNVQVNLSDGMLTIKGEKKEEKEEQKKDYHLSERRYGSFNRSFRVPDSVDADKIGASFKNGVLTVTMPKTAEAKKKQKTIEVKKG